MLLFDLDPFSGDLEAVLDPFLSEFEQTTVNRKQAALVINNILLGVIKDGKYLFTPIDLTDCLAELLIMID